MRQLWWMKLFQWYGMVCYWQYVTYSIARSLFLTERAIAGIILGLPLNMDGSPGPRVQSTHAFARNLIRLTDLPITFWDERLSTVAAERALRPADVMVPDGATGAFVRARRPHDSSLAAPDVRGSL